MSRALFRSNTSLEAQLLWFDSKLLIIGSPCDNVYKSISFTSWDLTICLLTCMRGIKCDISNEYKASDKYLPKVR